jgi:chromosome partitioning protein
MAVISTINRKGGSGKTTLATHIAVGLAQQSSQVMLVDADFQQSLGRWLQRRRRHVESLEFKHCLTDLGGLQRPLAGACHAVIDTPGSIQGFELSKLLLVSDLVLVPVADSIFDYESSADCVAEIRKHPKVAKGRVLLAVVGMKVEPGGAAERRLRDWASSQQLPYLGSVTCSTTYPLCADRGLTTWDALDEASSFDQPTDWISVMDGLDDLLATHRRHRESGKRLSQAQGRPDSGFGDSQFAVSSFGPVTRVASSAAMVNRVPGTPRREAQRGLIRRVLNGLPSWSMFNRNQPLV